MRLLKKLTPLSLALLSLQCSSTFPMDLSMAAAQAGDKTIIFQGPGVTSQKGYLFIQDRLGATPSDPISVIVPLVQCAPGRASCAVVQFFRPTGELGYSASIPFGQTQANFSLADIIGHSTPLTLSDEAEYDAVIRLYYLAPDDAGNTEETQTLFNGFVRLNVLQPGYSPAICGGPTIAWSVATSGSCSAQFTTQGRAATCGTGCH